MMKLMNKLMLSCKKATELMEKKNQSSLNPLETVQLFMHTSMCDACSLYERQSHFLDSLLKKQNGTQGSVSHKRKLPEEVKSQILSKLEKM